MGIGISVLTPTRNRPQNITKLTQSLIENADDPSRIEFIFYVDNDDETWSDDNVKHNQFTVVRGERIGIGKSINEIYKKAKHDLIFLCGDDVMCRTKGWDTIFIAAYQSYPDQIVQIFGEDLSGATPRLATHPCLSRKWIETIGYTSPPQFQGDYADNWMSDIGDIIQRRIYCSQVIMEHCHGAYGKNAMDSVYQEKWERDKTVEPLRIFNEGKIERIKEAEKLQKVIDLFADSIY